MLSKNVLAKIKNACIGWSRVQKGFKMGTQVWQLSRAAKLSNQFETTSSLTRRRVFFEIIVLPSCGEDIAKAKWKAMKAPQGGQAAGRKLPRTERNLPKSPTCILCTRRVASLNHSRKHSPQRKSTVLVRISDRGFDSLGVVYYPMLIPVVLCIAPMLIPLVLCITPV